MVKKFLVSFVILLMCSGCTVYSLSTMENQIDSYLNELMTPLKTRANNMTEYYSYYLPSDMVCGEDYEEGVVLYYSNSSMVMNLNVAGLINKDHYPDYSCFDEGFFDQSKLVYEKKGTYLNVEEETVSYFVKIYEVKDCFMIHLMSDEINTYALSLKEETYETVKHMVLIARSCIIRKEELLAGYSTDEDIDYERKQVDLFQYSIPKSGYLSELITESED